MKNLNEFLNEMMQSVEDKQPDIYTQSQMLEAFDLTLAI